MSGPRASTHGHRVLRKVLVHTEEQATGRGAEADKRGLTDCGPARPRGRTRPAGGAGAAARKADASRAGPLASGSAAAGGTSWVAGHRRGPEDTHAEGWQLLHPRCPLSTEEQRGCDPARAGL